MTSYNCYNYRCVGALQSHCLQHWFHQFMYFHYTASQMWLLGRLLPVIMGKYIPDDDEHWRCYLQMLRILTILAAIEITEDTVSVLSLLI